MISTDTLFIGTRLAFCASNLNAPSVSFNSYRYFVSPVFFLSREYASRDGAEILLDQEQRQMLLCL